jgi:predicted Zn-dependent protease
MAKDVFILTTRKGGVMLALVLILCITTLGASDVSALSIEEERVLGEKFLSSVLSQFELVEDEFANQYIYDLGQYLTGQLGTKHFPFRFYIVKAADLNAFAAPGGHVFVFFGLVDAFDHVDELAAVLCHEIGHVSARHISQRLEQAKKINIATMAGVLAGALLGGDAAKALMAGSMAAGIQAQLHYSRNDERQADQLGCKYTAQSGFEPRALISALSAIQRGHWYGTDQIPPYLLTHPTGTERMANLENILSQYPSGTPTKEAEHFSRLYPLFRTLLRALCMDPIEAERVFRVELKQSPDSYLPHFGLGVLYKETAEYDLALDHLKRSLEQERDSVPILTIIGEVYQTKGQDREAISILERAHALDPNDRAAIFTLATSYENLGQYDKAIGLFKRLEIFEPVKKEIYYHLGVCYGRLNRLAFAHYYLGVYFKKSREFDKARFHLLKADELSGNDQALKGKIQGAIKELG